MSRAAAAAGDNTAGAGGASGISRACCSRPDVGTPEFIKIRRYGVASQVERAGCPNLQDDANPTVRLESGRGNNHFRMNPSNS